MTTLLDLKNQVGLTNKQVGQALGVSASTAGDILHGRHIHVCSDATLEQLAETLGVTFERAWLAMCESYNVTYQTPGRLHQRASELQRQAEKTLQATMPQLPIVVSTPHPLRVVDAVSSSLAPQIMWLDVPEDCK